MIFEDIDGQGIKEMEDEMTKARNKSSDKKKGKNKVKEVNEVKRDTDFSGGKRGFVPHVRCYESHPVIPMLNGTIVGGSCGYPASGADIYVGLDSGMQFQFSYYPWLEAKPDKVEFLYHITDMSVPKDVPNFQKMITWLCSQLQLGKKVHIGCIGGHGRTGTVLAAIEAEANGTKAAIQRIRAIYCKKAVESNGQVDFLKTHYGVDSAEPAKSYSLSTTESGNTEWYKSSGGSARKEGTCQLPYYGGPSVSTLDDLKGRGYGRTELPTSIAVEGLDGSIW